MRRQLVSAVLAVLFFTVVTGILYPLVLTGVDRIAFPHQSAGSLLDLHGQPVGSSLIGQAFTDAKGHPLPGYFQTRPSASSDNGMASGGTNLGPSSPSLLTSERDLAAAYRSFNHVAADVPIPSDAVTTSGSGLDPDISIANAQLQAPRVAAYRHLPLSRVETLIRASTVQPALGILGEPVVDVLTLNVALDRLP